MINPKKIDPMFTAEADHKANEKPVTNPLLSFVSCSCRSGLMQSIIVTITSIELDPSFTCEGKKTKYYYRHIVPT